MDYAEPEAEASYDEHASIGMNICRWEPTNRLKFFGGCLCQVWEATGPMQDGGDMTRSEWRKVASNQDQ